MRESESDDLARVGRISHDFLIAGHGGVEAQLRDGLAGGTKPHAVENGSICKGKAGGWAWASGRGHGAVSGQGMSR